jgi:hypothetical protein
MVSIAVLGTYLISSSRTDHNTVFGEQFGTSCRDQGINCQDGSALEVHHPQDLEEQRIAPSQATRMKPGVRSLFR